MHNLEVFFCVALSGVACSSDLILLKNSLANVMKQENLKYY